MDIDTILSHEVYINIFSSTLVQDVYLCVWRGGEGGGGREYKLMA